MESIIQAAVRARQQTALTSLGARIMAYTGAWSMIMTHGVAVRFRFVVISFTNLHCANSFLVKSNESGGGHVLKAMSAHRSMI